MMKRNNLCNKNLHHRVAGASYVLAGAALAGLLGVSTLAQAQPAVDAHYRVGDLIESGSFTDTEAWTLEGFHVEKTGNISRKGEEGRVGTATTTFQGPDGYYKIRIRYQDEGDGVSQATITIGDRVVATWALDGIMVTTYPWKEFDGIKINKGDKIVLSATKSGYENGRYYGMEILPSKPRPAAPDATAIEKKEYSMNLVPVSESPAVKDNGKYFVGSGPLFTGSAGTYWVYLKQGQPFWMTVRASHSGGHPTLNYSLTKVGEDKPLAEETIVTEESTPIFVEVRDAPEGLYELKAGTAPGDRGSIVVDFDAPAVRTDGVREGYLFVPKGTKAFSAKVSGHLVLQDAANQVVLDDWFTKNATAVVDVPAGSDGQVWYFQGSLNNLAGVPPYFATRRDALLAPAEVLK